MKQKRRVSMIGVLVLIISALVLITGCSQPNGNKGNTGNNGGGNSRIGDNIAQYLITSEQVIWNGS